MRNYITLFLIFFCSLSLSQQHFTSSEYGFSMTFPDLWSVEKGTTSMVGVIARLNNTTSINVVVQDNDKWKDYNFEDMDTVSFKNDLEKKYVNYFTDFKPLECSRTKINGNNAIYFVYNCSLNGDVLHAKQYFIFKEDKIYVISTGCLEKEYKNYFEIVFDECVNSFTFTN